MELKTWLMYLLTDVLLNLSPGPAVMLISAQGLKFGARASYYGSIGISGGNLTFFILSALGLGTLILTAGNVFDYIKFAGAVYLIVSGSISLYHSFKKGYQAGDMNTELNQNYTRSFFQGFITQISNPKAIIFFVALLPQFVDPDGNIFLQFAIFGLTTLITETSVLILYGSLAARGRKMAGQSTVFAKWRDRLSGSVLIGLGVNLFFLKKGTI